MMPALLKLCMMFNWLALLKGRHLIHSVSLPTTQVVLHQQETQNNVSQDGICLWYNGMYTKVQAQEEYGVTILFIHCLF